MTRLPQKFSVRVTAKNIREGKRGDPKRCALALALERHTGQVWVAQPGWAVPPGRPHGLDWSRRYLHDGTYFIEDFDNCRPVQPCTIHLERIR